MTPVQLITKWLLQTLHRFQVRGLILEATAIMCPTCLSNSASLAFKELCNSSRASKTAAKASKNSPKARLQQLLSLRLLCDALLLLLFQLRLRF